MRTPVSQPQRPEQSTVGNRKSEEEHDGQNNGQDRLGALKDRKIIGNEVDEKNRDEEKMEDVENKDSKDVMERKAEKQEEITPEIKVKLRKLDKLEPKYQGPVTYCVSCLFRVSLIHLQNS